VISLYDAYDIISKFSTATLSKLPIADNIHEPGQFTFVFVVAI